jgi:ComF family protein
LVIKGKNVSAGEVLLMKGDFSLLRTIVQGLMDLVWPPRTCCLLCGGLLEKLPGLACEECWAAMRFPEGYHGCFHCARPLAEGARVCKHCAAGSPFGYVYALGLHAGPLREAVHHLKFGDREELAVTLGHLLAGRVSACPDCLVPVPLHRARLRERGYNQATLIARAIADELSIPVIDNHLKRLRSTGHQAKLHRAGRMRNLTGAFGVSRLPAPWEGKSVLVVDDVLTTGATAAAVAGVLRETGAAEINLAVLAVSTTPVKGNPENAH